MAKNCPVCGEEYISKLGNNRYIHLRGIWENGKYYPGKECKKEYKPNDAFQKWIVNLLATEGVLSRNEILARGEKELGLSQGTVKTYHTLVKQEGLIEAAEVPVGGNPRRGYWKLSFVDPVKLIRWKNED